MVRDMSLRFLGTSSQTNPTRNYSSLLVKLDHQTAMVDCGEATQRQLQNHHIGGEEKLSSIRHIFITHLHQDHVLGLVPLLCTMMGPGGSSAESSTEPRPRVEIYGPSGIRALIRTTLTLCYTNLHGLYTVHELLWPEQSAYLNEAIVSSDAGVVTASLPESADPLLGANNGPRRVIPYVPPVDSELPGKDFRLDDESASWPSIATINGVSVSAAPILHRCPTVGYVFEEPAGSSNGITDAMIQAVDANADVLREQHGIAHPRSLLSRVVRDRQEVELPDGTILRPPALDEEGRKVVVLGDTYDASAGLDGHDRGMRALAHGADVLVHESTNVALPGYLLPGKRSEDERREEVRAKAVMRGHSTPQTAGSFAGRHGVRQLLLNHFSVRYPAPHPLYAPEDGNGASPHSEKDRKYMVIKEIERQATEAWHTSQTTPDTKRSAIAAYDGFIYHVPTRRAANSGQNAGQSERETVHNRNGGRNQLRRSMGANFEGDHPSTVVRDGGRGRGRGGAGRGRGRGRPSV